MVYAIIVGLVCLAVGFVIAAFRYNWGYWKAIAATSVGAASYAVLYLAKNYFKVIWVKGLVPMASAIALIDKLPPTVFNAVVAILFAPMLANAIRTGLKKNHLTLD